MRRIFLLSLFSFSVLFLGLAKETQASIVFNQTPPNEIRSFVIPDSTDLISFGCSFGLNCNISGQTVYNVGVWIKKVGNPDDISLNAISNWSDPTNSVATSSGTVYSSTVSDKYYTLHWFYFPEGIVIGERGGYNQVFQIRVATTTGVDSQTNHYRILADVSNDTSAPQQWCINSHSCIRSKFYWIMDNSPSDLSEESQDVEPRSFTGNIFSQLDSSEVYEVTSKELNVMQSIGTGKTGTITKIKIKIGQDSDYEWNGSYSITLHDLGENNVYTGVRQCYRNNSSTDFFSKGLADQDIVFDDSTVTCSGGMTLTLDPTHYYTFQIAIHPPGWTNTVTKFYIAGSSSETENAPAYLANTTDYPGTIKTVFMQVDGVGVIPPTPKYSSVLFLPGIMASRLYKTGVINCSINCEDQLWEPNANSDAEDLSLDYDGKSIDDRIYTRDVIDEAYGTLNVYKSFLAKLEEMKVEDETIGDYSVVPYDWRLSIDDILEGGTKTGDNISYIKPSDDPYILSELNRLASSSENGKVTIIAHSNGGLITKALLKKLSDTNDPLLQKIDKVIFVAVPHLGTPAAIPALLHGYKQGISVMGYTMLSEEVARELGKNLPSAYNLLPSNNYFTYVDNPVVKFDETLPDSISRYGEVIHSQELLHNFLVGLDNRVDSADENTDTPTFLWENLLNNAEAEHLALDAWVPPSNIEVTEIAGWGVPITVSGLKYYKKKDKIKKDPIFTIDGDGTVVTPSALWAGGATSTDKYWVDLKQYNNSHADVKHSSILETKELRTLINNIILATSTQPLPQYISTSIPTAGAKDTRLIYALHSPLTIDIYDDFGNHTNK
ncbi:MAG: Lecithin:cholesterol acyltransferase [Parcubacteria group bacterium GW2011_GWB1_40_5]|nr:MAG: Lecithin:cholesterol acyltransferase [Parcubacteria group bacterium GW2011_GWB1_40_5]